MDPYMIDLVLKEKREAMLQDAARLRQLAEYESSRRKTESRLGLAVGEILIRLGERLKNRYEPKVEAPAG